MSRPILNPELRKTIELFDKALTSNNDTVKDALNTLIAVVGMVHTENDRDFGPIMNHFAELHTINRELDHNIMSLRDKIYMVTKPDDKRYQSYIKYIDKDFIDKHYQSYIKYIDKDLK